MSKNGQITFKNLAANAAFWDIHWRVKQYLKKIDKHIIKPIDWSILTFTFNGFHISA